MAKWFRNTAIYQKLWGGAPSIYLHSLPTCYLAVCDFRAKTLLRNIKAAEYRCRRPKTYEKEETCAARAIPKSTIPDINKWADF